MTSDDVSFGNKYGDRMEEVFGAVKDGAHTRPEIIAAVTVPENQIDVYLRRLVLARWLYRPRRGEYAVATAEVRFMVEDYDTGRRAKRVRGTAGDLPGNTKDAPRASRDGKPEGRRCATK